MENNLISSSYVLLIFLWPRSTCFSAFQVIFFDDGYQYLNIMAEDSNVISGEQNEIIENCCIIDQNGTPEDMPDFSDPEDYVDNISDEG